MKKSSLETRLVNSILQYSMYNRDKMFLIRNNTGAIKFKRPDESDAFIKFGARGSADLIGLIYPGLYIAIECKVGKNKLTALQKEFANSIDKLGGIYLEIRSLEQFIDSSNFIFSRYENMQPFNEGLNYGKKEHLV